MTYRQAAQSTNRSKIELKTEFEDILEAMQEIGYSKEINQEILNFWLYGSVPSNYQTYLNLLDATELLRRYSIPPEHIRDALSEHSPIDRYILFKNACLNFVGEKVEEDFKHLVVDPLLKMYVEPNKKSKAEKMEKLTKGRATIKALNKSISKTIQELHKIEPYNLAATDVQSILITLENLEQSINEMEG